MKNNHEEVALFKNKISPIPNFENRLSEMENKNFKLFDNKSDSHLPYFTGKCGIVFDKKINESEVTEKVKNCSFLQDKNKILKGKKRVKLSHFQPLKQSNGDDPEIKEEDENKTNETNNEKKLQSTVFKISENLDLGVQKQKSPSIHEMISVASQIEEYEKNQFELVKKIDKVTPNEIVAHKISLSINPFNKNKKTLVISLENNLIYLVPSKTRMINPDSKIPIIKFSKSDEMNEHFFLLLRPYSMEFLQKLYEFYEIIVFSHFEKYISEEIIKYLDPKNKCISHLLNQSHCIKKDKIFIRNISIIENRNFENLIFVSESLNDFRDKINNGILVNPFIGKLHDNELESVCKLLINLATTQDDVRNVLNKIYKLKEKFEIYIQEEPYESEPGKTSKKVFFPPNLL